MVYRIDVLLIHAQALSNACIFPLLLNDAWAIGGSGGGALFGPLTDFVSLVEEFSAVKGVTEVVRSGMLERKRIQVSRFRKETV